MSRVFIGAILVAFAFGCRSAEPSKKSPGTTQTSDTTSGSLTATTTSDCPVLWYADVDGDGFGDPDTAQCTEAPGFVEDNTDCNDGDDAVYPDAPELCDAEDNDCDLEVDELFDDLDGDQVPDCEETLMLCENFESTLYGWDFLGNGEWLQQYGAIYEERGGLYGAVMYTVDAVGAADKFRLETRTAFTGSLNDMAGIVWSVDPDASTYLVARWDDPQHDYQRHSPPGAMEIVECTDEVTCPVVALDRSAILYWPADGTFVTWSVAVDHGQVTITWDGQVVFDDYVKQAVDRGPGRVGLYSNDNDGGVQFDDFCVWITPDVPT